MALRDVADQIVCVIAPSPPYALPPAVYRFPALTSWAGRAALGREREFALACLMVARLVSSAIDDGLPAAARRSRSTAARLWLATLALPTNVRDACVKAIDATTADVHSEALRSACARVIELASGRLDAAALSELRRLARAAT